MLEACYCWGFLTLGHPLGWDILQLAHKHAYLEQRPCLLSPHSPHLT